MSKEKFYITTPIYYPSDKLHIGHSYCTVATDAMARYKRLRGYDVKFLTGTDEHGQKIERIAKEKGITPKEYVDGIVKWIKELWKTMDISYDCYIRTTDEKHQKAVQKIFRTLYDKGDIYKGSYEGWYCTPCESFYTQTQLVDGKCPECHREVEKIKEESYFFKLSKYQDKLINYIEENPDFIQPETRKNEMINNFLKPGLKDLCVSRTSLKWGIPVDFDDKHVIYVWIDALSNYISALGYGSEDDSDFKKYWPADVHVVGKEIVRFHTIIWPAILMALDLPLPKKIFGHGWLIINGGKMSKSLGNIVDPKVLVEKYGVDAVRYFLLREIAFGQDGNFTSEALIQRINSDLANDLGNLLSRTIGMIDKYFGSVLPNEQIENKFDKDIIELSEKTVNKVEEYMEKMFFSNALEEIWKFIRRCNKYIDETAPWIVAKDEGRKKELADIMYVLLESLRIISILISPFMPNTPKIIWKQIGIDDEKLKSWDSIHKFGMLNKNAVIKKGEVIFPRIDIKKELENLQQAIEKSQSESIAKKEDEYISFEDFSKIKMKLGQVIKCENIEGSDKLLKSQIKIGNQTVQIVSGIAKYYTPEQMIGKKVVVVTNLKPRKIFGNLSEGMILAASDENGNLDIITVDSNIENGAEIG